jgi:hypothetical protein
MIEPSALAAAWSSLTEEQRSLIGNGNNQYTSGGGTEKSTADHVARVIKGHGADTSSGIGSNHHGIETKDAVHVERFKNDVHSALIKNGFEKGKTYTSNPTNVHATSQTDYHKGNIRVVLDHTKNTEKSVHFASVTKYGPRSGPKRS